MWAIAVNAPEHSVWVRHWRSGRPGLATHIDPHGKNICVHFPDTQGHTWRWASAFEPSGQQPFWVCHWRSGRRGLAVQAGPEDEKLSVYFPDTRGSERRWAAAFTPLPPLEDAAESHDDQPAAADRD